MCVLLENKAFSWLFTFRKNLEHNNRVYNFQGNTKLYEKYMTATFEDQFYRRHVLKMSKNFSRL